MAEGSSGATGILGVLIGALIVGGIGFFLITGGNVDDTKKLDVKIEAPAAPTK